MCVLCIDRHSQSTRTQRISWGNLPWLAFIVQVLLVVAVEGSDELLRGLIVQRDRGTGIANALQVVNFERVHGFWVEPAWQTFFTHTHHLLGLTFTWDTVKTLTGLLYSLGHPLVTLAFAIWLFASRRSLFPVVRDALFLTSAGALVLYESFPLAPPRLATGLVYDGHPFRFQDTLFAVLGSDGKVLGTQIGYDEFAAMPSIHVAWALTVGLVLAWTLRPLVLRLLALLYPAAMLLAVVVTGNHYLLDAIVAAVLLGAAFAISIGWHAWLARRSRPAAVETPEPAPSLRPAPQRVDAA